MYTTVRSKRFELEKSKGVHEGAPTRSRTHYQPYRDIASFSTGRFHVSFPACVSERPWSRLVCDRLAPQSFPHTRLVALRLRLTLEPRAHYRQSTWETHIALGDAYHALRCGLHRGTTDHATLARPPPSSVPGRPARRGADGGRP